MAEFTNAWSFASTISFVFVTWCLSAWLTLLWFYRKTSFLVVLPFVVFLWVLCFNLLCFLTILSVSREVTIFVAPGGACSPMVHFCYIRPRHLLRSECSSQIRPFPSRNTELKVAGKILTVFIVSNDLCYGWNVGMLIGMGVHVETKHYQGCNARGSLNSILKIDLTASLIIIPVS